MDKRIYLIICAFISACATSGASGLKDANTEFSRSIPTNPKFKIESLGINRFQVTVYQGSALLSEKTTRESYLQIAAFLAMDQQCHTVNQALKEYQLHSSADGFGFINLIGIFSCKEDAPDE